MSTKKLMNQVSMIRSEGQLRGFKIARTSRKVANEARNDSEIIEKYNKYELQNELGNGNTCPYNYWMKVKLNC